MSLVFIESVNAKTLSVPRGSHFTVQAKPGEKYYLVDQNTQKTPKDLEVSRAGDKLVLSSKSNDIEIIIEEFWGECRVGNQCFAIFDTPAEVGGELVGQTVITQE